MRKNPHVRICGGLGSATTLVYPTPLHVGVLLLPEQTSSFDILGPVKPSASKFSVLFTAAAAAAMLAVDSR